MAEIKTVELQIKSNVNTASKEFDSFAKSIKAVDNSATNLDATFEEVYGDLKPLTARMGEAEDRLYELALAGKQSSEEFKDLLTSVSNYRKTQIQTDMAVDAASVTLGQKLTGSLEAVSSGFTIAQGIMGTFGAESEDVEKAILKVQSAMAITQGLTTLRESVKSVQALSTVVKASTVFQKAATAAQWLWNTAMSANPIGAVVAGVTALIVAGYKLIKFFQNSSDANEKAAKATEHNTKALKNQSLQASQSSTKLQTYNDHQYNLAKAAGASSEELRKLALKHKEEEVALNKKNAVLARATFLRERDTLAALKASDASDDVIEKQEELTKSSYDFFKKQNEILSNSYKERAALRRSQEVEVVAERKAAKDKAIEDANEAKEKAKEAKEKAKEEAEKRLEDRKREVEKFNEQELELNTLTDDLKKSQADKERDKELERIKMFADADLKRSENELAQSNARKLIAEEEYSQKIELANAASNTLSQLADLVGKQTAAGKALGIASATINTYVGVTEALQQKSTLPSPFDVVAKVANVATVLATGFKAVKAITSVKVPAGGGASASSPVSISGGASATAAPQFNVVGTSGQNQIAQSLGNQAPVKAYVVSNDVTTAQSLDRNIVKTATVG